MAKYVTAHRVNIEPDGRFANRMLSRMEQKRLTINDMKAKTGMSYEHIRKLVRGLAYPSPWGLQLICEVLDLNYEEMHQLTIADKLENKYGGIPHALIGQHPELSLLAPYWDKLTIEQRETVTVQIKSLADSNQANNALAVSQSNLNNSLSHVS